MAVVRVAGVVTVTLVAGGGCADDTPSQTDTSTTDGGSGTSNMTTQAMTTQAMTTMAQDTGTTMAPDTGTTVASDSGTTVSADTGTSSGTMGTTGDASSGSSGSSDSGSTGDSGTTGSGDCVDEDIGMAVGEAIVSGTTIGQGDDFDWGDCSGGFDSGGFIVPGDDGVGGVDDGDPGPPPKPGKGGGAKFGIDKGPGDDYVIAWTPPATATYVLSLDGSNYDTFLSVHPAECGSMDEECNDDCYDLQSGLTYDATMGETVFIVVDGYGGLVGNFTLSITQGGDAMCDFGAESGGFESGVFDTGIVFDTGVFDDGAISTSGAATSGPG